MGEKSSTIVPGIDLPICIYNMRRVKNTKGTLKATFNIRYGDIIMKWWKVVSDQKGHIFICPKASKSASGVWYDDIYFVEKATRILIEDMALSVFNMLPPEPGDICPDTEENVLP